MNTLSRSERSNAVMRSYEKVGEDSYPRFVSFVAFAVGCFDLVRGFVHAPLAGSTAALTSGIDLSGPSAGDQIMLMAAFGHANFITGAALIYLSFTSRAGSVFMMTVIPVALAIAGASVNYWTQYFPVQGEFPGRYNMMVYFMACIATVVTAHVHCWNTQHQTNS